MGLLFILLLITIQPRAQEIKIRYERDDKGNIRFIADNSTLRPYFVVIEFSGLTGSMTITPGEVLRIKPGEKQLFTIKKVQDAPLFSSYKYKYYTSDPSAKINPDYPYLIPVKVGVKVRTIPVRYISTIIGKGTATNLYSISFQINDKDTICASRGGIVVETKDQTIIKPLVKQN